MADASIPEIDFDHHAPDFNADAWSRFEDLRNRCPIARSRHHGGFWVVSRFEEIDEVLHRPDDFSSQYVAVPPILGIGDLRFPPLNLDPPDHGPVKRIMKAAFLPKKVEQFQPDVQRIVTECMDELLTAKIPDASIIYARGVPLKTMAMLLDLPQEDYSQFTDWVRAMIDLAGNPDAAMAAGFELMEYFRPLIEDRQTNAGRDVISMLIEADVDGRKLTDEELLLGSIQLLLAGIDTTWSTLATIFLYLAEQEEHQTLLRTQPDLIPTAVEEFMRAFGPVSIARVAARDTQIGGCPVAKGDMIYLPLPSANHDSERYANPDEVRFDRSDIVKHMGFGAGIHKCLGAGVARMEMAAALEELLGRTSRFGLDPGHPVVWSTGQVRGPRELVLQIDPS